MKSRIKSKPNRKEKNTQGLHVGRLPQEANSEHLKKTHSNSHSEGQTRANLEIDVDCTLSQVKINE